MTARKIISFTAALAMATASIGIAAPAQARDHGSHHSQSWNKHDRDGRYDRYDRYDRHDRYDRDVRVRYQTRDRDGRYYDERCRSNSSAGTIIGAIAGGLIGHEVAGRHGDKTAGTLIGGAVGAVAGTAIAKNDRCR